MLRNEPGTPDPRGHRDRIPPSLQVLIGYPEGPGRSIIVALQNKRERQLFTAAFLELGWRVEPARDIIEAGSIGREVITPHVVLTDQPEMISSVRSVFFATSDLVALVDANDEAVQRAWSNQADWVITRPIDPNDPLGFRLT